MITTRPLFRLKVAGASRSNPHEWVPPQKQYSCLLVLFQYLSPRETTNELEWS